MIPKWIMIMSREPRLRLRAMLPRWRKQRLRQPERQNKPASHLEVLPAPDFVTYSSIKSDRLVPRNASGNGIRQKHEYPLDF
jgi:hypothetical protein